ncbi:MAG TPA: efflux RND transporter periplasmic adaptor subunit, partial [Gemmataceae bacterium]|nr:efflux RND transporter periplasmic adaptor subunit [Gemmataceae bacterium]
LVQAKPSTKNNGQNPNIAGNAETRSVFTPVPAPKQASPIGGPDGVQVRVRVTGEIVKVLAKSGADVKKGDLLLQIESPQYKANLAAAQATVDEAKATMALVDANTRRTQELANKGVVSTAELDKARFELDRARANVRFAEAKAELARLSLDATSVRAPVDGKIGAILVTEGTHAIADQTILVIVQSKAEAK